MPLSRAHNTVSSISLKSNFPSSGSIKSHCAGTRRVLSPIAFIRGITSSISSTEVAAELLNSPPSINIGLPLTSNIALVLLRRSLTCDITCNDIVNRNTNSIIFCLIIIMFNPTVIRLFSNYTIYKHPHS